MDDNESEPDNASGDGDGDGDGEAAAASQSGDEEELFDISLPATHSYMGEGLEVVGGRSVREAGWEGVVPAVAHHGAIFPGETVPMLLPRAHDAELLIKAIQNDKLFALLCPDESGTLVSGYGVLCEVFEAALPGDRSPAALSFKARAVWRVRALGCGGAALAGWWRARPLRVRVLPDVTGLWPPHAATLPSLRPRTHSASAGATVSRMEAALTSWPPFLYRMFDFDRMRAIIHQHFCPQMLGALPEEPIALSFWVASNLALSARDRLALLAVDAALLRLHMELSLIAKESSLCCASCVSEIARRQDMLAMSSEGVHANFTNLGGYMHDIMTVSRVSNVELSGSASSEFSWFPGYTWTIALCATCMAHVGWRFDAERPRLRPARFYGLCRNYVQPRADLLPRVENAAASLEPQDLELA